MNNNIEAKLEQLKKDIACYNNLPDIDKLKNLPMYQKIIKDKESCDNILVEYKNKISVRSLNPVFSDNPGEISGLLNRLNEIKDNLENTDSTLNDLNKLLDELTEIKSKLDVYFSNIKMEIINL